MAEINSLVLDNAVQLFPRPHAPFNLRQYLAQEEKRVRRARHAAQRIGATHEWFLALSAPEQVAKLCEWIDAALDARKARLTGVEPDYEGD